jgi:hypothetical protein
MNTTERNTRANSLEKIWKNGIIRQVTLWRPEDCKLENVMAKIQEAVKYAKEHKSIKWEDITLVPTQSNNDCDEERSSIGYFTLYGWRLETEQEWRLRLFWIKDSMKKTMEGHEKYDKTKSEQRIAEIESLIGKQDERSI